MNAAAPLLAFAAGAAAPALLERLREHRVRPEGLPDLLGWLHLVAPGTVLQKSGSFLTGWSYRGPDLAAATPEELDALAAHLNDALLPYGDGWMFHVDFVRRPAQGYAPRGAFPDPVTAAIDEERRAAYEAARGHFVSDSFLVATYLPPREVYSRLAGFFIQGRPRARSAWAGLHARFEEEAGQLERRLSSHLKIARLSSRQLLTHLHACLTGLGHPVEPPPHGAYLDAVLADRALAGGWAPKVGELHLRLVALHGFPHASFPGILDFLGGLGFPFRASHRIIPLSQATGARHIARLRLSWFKRRRGAASWLRELSSSQGAAAGGGNRTAARERDDELFLDQDAAGMARDAAAAAAENASGRVRFCLYTPVLLVADADPGRADHQAAEILKALNDRGFTARLEDINALEALCGTLPGNGYANLRRPLVSTRNLADLLPVTSVWPGLPENPSPLFPRHSPALLWAATTGATPFWLNLHDDDVGHTLMVGGTGAGKSTLLNLLIAQFLRYPRAQVFGFDVGYSGWLLARAAGARHYDLAVEPVRLQPLAQIERPAERLWALDWLEVVLGVNGVAVTPAGRQSLDAALQLLATEPPAHRRLSDLLPQIQDRELVAALTPYAGGALRHLLDADGDDLARGGDGEGEGGAGSDGTARGGGAARAAGGLGGGWDGNGGGPYHLFELKRLAEMEDRALLPVLLHLFHRVEQRLEQGRPSLLVVEEAWLPLMKSAFAARIKQWLLTLRKQNAAVVLATQSLSQLWESPHRHLLLESCPTRILLPNPEAASPGHVGLYRDLGLNDGEIQLLARARRKRDYYVKSPRGSRLFELGLGPLALAFVGTPEGMTQAEAIAEARPLIERHGAAWPREWLARRGVAAPTAFTAFTAFDRSRDRLKTRRKETLMIRTANPTRQLPGAAVRRRAFRLPLRRRGLVLAAALLLLATAAPAAAQIPVTDAAHIAVNSYWHYLHYVQLAYQIYQHALQLANQVRQIEAQLRALRKLDDPNWREIQTLLAELDGLVRSGQAIGYALPDAGGQLRQVYPGWTPWQDPAAAPLQSERALDTMRAGLAAISRQSQSFGPGEQTLLAIRQQMTRTDGHQQALEQLATLGSFTAQEQLLTRQSLAVNANLQAVGQAYWIDREAQARATFRRLATETSLAAYQSTSPGWTFTPATTPLP